MIAKFMSTADMSSLLKNLKLQVIILGLQDKITELA